MASAFRTLDVTSSETQADLSSQVLKGVEVDVQPVVWRSQVRVAAPPAGTAATESADEVARLRARIAELTSAVEVQSRQAYEAGLRAGEAEARKQFDAEVQRMAETLAATIASLADTRAEAIHRAEADVVRLAIEISRRVLHREMSIDSSALEALIKAALEKLRGQELYRVRVHPDQERIVRACLDQLGRGNTVEVVEDPVLPPGGAVFEMARGSLDASVETQLREVERGLTDRLETRI